MLYTVSLYLHIYYTGEHNVTKLTLFTTKYSILDQYDSPVW